MLTPLSCTLQFRLFPTLCSAKQWISFRKPRWQRKRASSVQMKNVVFDDECSLVRCTFSSRSPSLDSIVVRGRSSP
eukprot:jgi/Botrbrau1/14771/Bobra.0284s0005.1